MDTQVKLGPIWRPYELEPPSYYRPQTGAEKLNQQRREAQELSLYEDGPWAEYENIIPGDTRSLELNVGAATKERDLRYLLCPQDVIGFDLKTRRWCKSAFWIES